MITNINVVHSDHGIYIEETKGGTVENTKVINSFE